MHTSESLDPVRSRLTDTLPVIDCWLEDMADGIHLLQTLTDYLHNPDVNVSDNRLVALLRSAVKSLTGGTEELELILNIAENALPPVPVNSPCVLPVFPSGVPVFPSPFTLCSPGVHPVFPSVFTPCSPGVHPSVHPGVHPVFPVENVLKLWEYSECF
jgi:hypothetical protein